MYFLMLVLELEKMGLTRTEQKQKRDAVHKILFPVKRSAGRREFFSTFLGDSIANKYDLNATDSPEAGGALHSALLIVFTLCWWYKAVSLTPINLAANI